MVRLRPVWMTNHPLSVLWHCWLGHQTVKNRRPYNLYCVGADVKPCSVNQASNPQPTDRWSDALPVVPPSHNSSKMKIISWLISRKLGRVGCCCSFIVSHSHLLLYIERLHCSTLCYFILSNRRWGLSEVRNLKHITIEESLGVYKNTQHRAVSLQQPRLLYLYFCISF